MAEKTTPNPDIPNDDTEALSAEEQDALDDRSTVGEARRQEEAEVLAQGEQPAQPQETAPVEAASAQPAKPEDKAEGKQVPLATLLEERAEFKRRIEEEALKRAELNAKLDLINQRLNQPKEPPQPINVDEQPIEALKETRQTVQQIAQAQQQLAIQQQFASHVGAQVQAFRQETPDYDDAYRYAREAYANELKAVYGLADAQIPQAIAQAEFNLSAAALQRGENPGKALYAFAQARGYKKAEMPAPAQQPTAQQRIETAQRGQQAAKSLSGGGSPPPAKLTLADIESMSDDEIAGLSEDKFRALFG